MERKSFADMHCSVAQCLEVVGEWWSMLILRDVFLGVTRFDDFQQRLGISRNILNQRLNHLVDAGVLAKVALQRAPASSRLPPHRQGARPLAGAHRHAPVGRQIRRARRPAGGGDPQGLRGGDAGGHGLFGVRGAARRP